MIDTTDEYVEEEDMTNENLNMVALTNKNSEMDTLRDNQEKEEDEMLTGGRLNSWLNGDSEDMTSEEEGVSGGMLATTSGAVDEGIKKETSDRVVVVMNSAMAGDPQSVIQNVHALSSLTASTPATFRNEVIAKVADAIKDMRIGNEKVFKNETQLMNFIKGIFTGQPTSKSKHVDNMMKRAKLTQHMNINPALRRRIPRPITPSGNYVYRGNSMKTII